MCLLKQPHHLPSTDKGRACAAVQHVGVHAVLQCQRGNRGTGVQASCYQFCLELRRIGLTSSDTFTAQITCKYIQNWCNRSAACSVVPLSSTAAIVCVLPNDNQGKEVQDQI